MRCIYAVFLSCLVVFALSCKAPTADQKQRKATEAIADQAQQQVGMPGITNFTERRIVRKLYEMRDQNTVTYSYVLDMQGRLWFLCNSLGYGLPYGVQFTNPTRPLSSASSQTAMIDQPEPNGLFMPPGADGTWVICAGKKSGQFDPIYVEPLVIVSPFKLRAEGSYQEEPTEAEPGA